MKNEIEVLTTAVDIYTTVDDTLMDSFYTLSTLTTQQLVLINFFIQNHKYQGEYPNFILKGRYNTANWRNIIPQLLVNTFLSGSKEVGFSQITQAILNLRDKNEIAYTHFIYVTLPSIYSGYTEASDIKSFETFLNTVRRDKYDSLFIDLLASATSYQFRFIQNIYYLQHKTINQVIDALSQSLLLLPKFILSRLSYLTPRQLYDVFITSFMNRQFDTQIEYDEKRFEALLSKIKATKSILLTSFSRETYDFDNVVYLRILDESIILQLKLLLLELQDSDIKYKTIEWTPTRPNLLPNDISKDFSKLDSLLFYSPQNAIKTNDLQQVFLRLYKDKSFLDSMRILYNNYRQPVDRDACLKLVSALNQGKTQEISQKLLQEVYFNFYKPADCKHMKSVNDYMRHFKTVDSLFVNSAMQFPGNILYELLVKPVFLDSEFNSKTDPREFFKKNQKNTKLDNPGQRVLPFSCLQFVQIALKQLLICDITPVDNNDETKGKLNTSFLQIHKITLKVRDKFRGVPTSDALYEKRYKKLLVLAKGQLSQLKLLIAEIDDPGFLEYCQAQMANTKQVLLQKQNDMKLLSCLIQQYSDCFEFQSKLLLERSLDFDFTGTSLNSPYIPFKAIKIMKCSQDTLAKYQDSMISFASKANHFLNSIPIIQPFNLLIKLNRNFEGKDGYEELRYHSKIQFLNVRIALAHPEKVPMFRHLCLVNDLFILFPDFLPIDPQTSKFKGDEAYAHSLYNSIDTNDNEEFNNYIQKIASLAGESPFWEELRDIFGDFLGSSLINLRTSRPDFQEEEDEALFLEA